ncbi:MAG: LPS-assembly protein LptD [Opitutaceae bacterium]|nr:LPS-assembly protein LptD [Opitutaceae bacterium]
MRVLFHLQLWVLFIAVLDGAPGANVPPEAFSAEKTEFDLDTREWIGRGNASLAVGDATLTASEIRFRTTTGVALARGNVILQQGAQRLLADEITYDLGKRSIDVRNLRVGSDPIYVSGDHLSGTKEDLTVENARATFREPGFWTPTITADRMTLHKLETISVQRGRVGIGQIQPIPLPGFPIPVDQAFLRYLTVGAGYRASLGAFFEIGVHVPVLRGVEAGIDTGFYTQRGLLAGPSGEYAFSKGEHQVSGSLKTGFIHDNGDKLSDVIGVPIQEDRGFVQWSHRESFNRNFSLNADLNFWSDSDILRDFLPDQYFPVQQPDNYVEANYVNDAVVVGAFIRPNLNRYFRVQERLPEIRATLLPRLVSTPELGIYQRGHASFVRLTEDEPLLGPGLRTDRLDAYFALSRPFSPRDWFAFRPVAGGEVTHYSRVNPGSDGGGYTRFLGELGIDAELRASGTYSYQNKAWKIDGLRHLVTPRLSYRYIPGADHGLGRIPPIDRSSFSTYLQPLGLGDRRNIDELGSAHALRMEIDNTLQTRDPVYGSRDLVRLNLAADLRFDRENDASTLSDLHADLVLSPARWLNFNLYQRYSTRDQTLEELNTSFIVANSEWWSLRLGTHYLRNDIEEYVMDSRIRLNEEFEAFARLHYDAPRSRFVQQTYGIRQTLDNLWVLQYGVNLYEGRRRESSFGFVIELETLRF